MMTNWESPLHAPSFTLYGYNPIDIDSEALQQKIQECLDQADNKSLPPFFPEDIPIQAVGAKTVSKAFNWTIWVLYDDDWKLVMNEKINTALLELAFYIIKFIKDPVEQVRILQKASIEVTDLDTENPKIAIRDIAKAVRYLVEPHEHIEKLLEYRPWKGVPMFTEAYKGLFEAEEERYGWGKPLWSTTDPFYIQWWWNGLTLFRDYYLKKWMTFMVPDFSWPNAPWIWQVTIKKKPTPDKTFDSEWNVNFWAYRAALQKCKNKGEKEVWIYLNFPSNPMSSVPVEEQMKELNEIFAEFSGIKINVVVDDPYGVFAVEWEKWEKKVKKPTSYMIDTEKNQNVIVLELWSHGTKEAGIYWFRSAVARVITHEGNVQDAQDGFMQYIRETNSMSPSLQQFILTKAILWKGIDPFGDPNKLTEEEQRLMVEAINKYLDCRQVNLEETSTRVVDFRNAILSKNGEYLKLMWAQLEEDTTNGFFITFALTDEMKKKWLLLEELRQICVSGDTPKDDRIWFATFERDWEWDREQVMRISLVSWSFDEYSKSLNRNIERWLENK